MAVKTLMDKINGLFALAMDDGATPAERALALKRAEAMKRKHDIEDFELSQSGQKASSAIKIENFDIDMPAGFYSQVNYLVNAVFLHCKVRYTWKNYYFTAEMVGRESDIEFAKGLWYVVYRELAYNLYPVWSESRTFEQNVYAFVKGGFKWRLIAEAANAAGVEVKWPDNGRLKRAYHNECKAREEEPTAHTQRHDAFRLSYVASYQSRISQRLREMDAYAAEEDSDSGEKYAVVLADTRERVDAEFFKLHPEYDPEVQRKRSQEAQEAEEARRAAMTEKQREEEDRRDEREYQRFRRQHEKMRDRTYDANGWNHGTKVANNVDLSGGRNHITPDRKVLP